MSEIFFENNTIGKLHTELGRLIRFRDNKSCRVNWGRYIFSDDNYSDEQMSAKYPALVCGYSDFIKWIYDCRGLAASFSGYPERLYAPAFDGILSTIIESWENPHAGFDPYCARMQVPLEKLEHVADRASKEIGYPNAIGYEIIENVTSKLDAIEAMIESGEIDSVFSSHLKRASNRTREAIDAYVTRGENKFHEAIGDIWKEIFIYLSITKPEASKQAKDKISSSGIFTVIPILAQCASILASGNAILSIENCETVVNLLGMG